jgi:hypothetical protein
MNYSVQEMPDDQPAQGKVRFEQACFKCGSHYCLMDCVKEEPEPAPERTWVGLTDKELEDAFYHVEYDTTVIFYKDPDKWCQEFYKRIDRLLEEKNK